MTDAELQGLGAQALNMAKGDMERGQFNFLFASYHQGEGLHRMKSIEALVVEKLGEEWLNSGRAKDMAFKMLRMATSMLPPDGIVIVTAANRFSPTEKLLALPLAEQEAVVNASHHRHHKAVEEGLLTVCDSLHALVQTARRVCQYIQDYEPGALFLSKPETRFYAQADFGGRLKMYP
jgi:hypothetical protein